MKTKILCAVFSISFLCSCIMQATINTVTKITNITPWVAQLDVSYEKTCQSQSYPVGKTTALFTAAIQPNESLDVIGLATSNSNLGTGINCNMVLTNIKITLMLNDGSQVSKDMAIPAGTMPLQGYTLQTGASYVNFVVQDGVLLISGSDTVLD